MELLEAFEILAGKQAVNSIVALFPAMDIVEEKIEEARAEYGETWDQWSAKMEGVASEDAYNNGPLWDTFLFLRPPEHILNERKELIARHAEELLARVAWFEENIEYSAENRDNLLLKQLAPATDSEIVMAFVEASLAAPLNQLGFNCYATVFENIFPMLSADIVGDRIREDWDNQVSDMLWQIKTKFPRHRGEPRKRSNPAMQMIIPFEEELPINELTQLSLLDILDRPKIGSIDKPQDLPGKPIQPKLL